MDQLVTDVREGSYQGLEPYLNAATGRIFGDDGPLELVLYQAQHWRAISRCVDALRKGGMVCALDETGRPV
jgi:hypothetical protein